MTATRRRAAITPTINDSLISSGRTAPAGPPASHQHAWEGSWLPSLPSSRPASRRAAQEQRQATQPAARRRSSGPVSRSRPHHRADPASPGPGGVARGTGASPAAAEAAQPGPGSAERLAYSVDEAARLTGLSRDLLYDQMRRGNLAYVKVGRRRLITRQHLQQFLGLAS